MAKINSSGETRGKTEETQMTHEQLEKELLPGLRSGPAIEMTPLEWKRFHEELEERSSKERHTS